MFDIALADTATLSNRGVDMEVMNAKTGLPFRDENDAVVTITLLGRNSDIGRQHEHMVKDRRLEAARRGKLSVDTDDIESDLIDFLTMATLKWSFERLDGQDFPCTADNARKFWSDKRFRNVRDQAEAFTNDYGNFMQDSSKT